MSAFVQAAAGSTGGSQATSVTAAYSTNNTGGNFLIAVCRNFYTSGGTPTTSITDSAGNTWTKAPGEWTDGPSGALQSVFYVTSCIAGANTVTMHSNNSNFLRLVVLEYSGLTGQDKNNHGGGNSTSFNSGNVTTSQTETLLGIIQNETSDADTYTAAGWTFRKADPTGNMNVYDKIDQVAGTYSFQGTVNNTAQWAATLQTFTTGTGMVATGIQVIIMD